MQDQKIKSHSNTRKPWYQRAIEMATQWKTISKAPEEVPTTIYSTLSSKNKATATRNINISSTPNGSLMRKATTCRSSSNTPITSTTPPEGGKLRKSTSLRVAASSFTRVCLCAPLSSYNNEVFKGDVMPRRSYSYPRSKPFPTSIQDKTPTSTRLVSTELLGRRIFRGKSLRDDVLMKRFVLEEEMMMQIRRRNEMEVIRRRRSMLMRRKQIGPSRLSRMSLAQVDVDA